MIAIDTEPTQTHHNMFNAVASRSEQLVHIARVAFSSILAIEGVAILAQDNHSSVAGAAIVAGSLSIGHSMTRLRGGYCRNEE